MNRCQVLLSAYNGEKYIEQQINSILNQSDVHVELSVRIDGSNDNTDTILSRYKDNLFYYHGRNIGVVKSFWELLTKSNNDCQFYSFSDQDDCWLPEKISHGIKLLETYENQNIPLLYCSNLYVADQNLNILNMLNGEDLDLEKINFCLENCVTGCTIIMNKVLRDFLLSLNVNLNNIIMHDWLIAFIASKFGKIIYDKNSFILYRQHGNNVVGANKRKISFIDGIKKVCNKNPRLFAQLQEFNKIYKEIKKTNLPELSLITKKNFFSRLIEIRKFNDYKINKKTKRLYLLGYFTC